MTDSSVIKKDRHRVLKLDKHRVLKLAQYSFLIPYIPATAITILTFALECIICFICFIGYGFDTSCLYIDMSLYNFPFLQMLLVYWVTPWLTILVLCDPNFDIGYHIRVITANSPGLHPCHPFIPGQDMILRDCIVPCFITIVVEIILYIISIICIEAVDKKYKVNNNNNRALKVLIGFIIMQVIATIAFIIHKNEYIIHMLSGTEMIIDILG